MVASKINQADAQEWLESLQQVGEGWWRQANLALSMGAHRALGMEARQFVLAIGRQQTLDAKDAVVEMHESGTSMTRISEIVGMHLHSVKMILAEAGRIEVTPQIQRMLETGLTEPDRVDNRLARRDSAEETDSRDAVIDAEVVEDDTAARLEEAEAKAERLAEQLAAARAKVRNANSQTAKELAEAQERNRKLARERGDLKKQLQQVEAAMRGQVEEEITEQERARLLKEAEAGIDEKREGVMQGLAFLLVDPIINSLAEAAEGVKVLMSQVGSITGEQLRQIENAHAAFIEELNVARMSERT